MPRLTTPSRSVFLHRQDALAPYARRVERSPSRLSSSDKENATPEQTQSPRVTATQRARLGERPSTQYYDPLQPREKTRDTMQEYRRLIQETTGIAISSDPLTIESRAELLKAGNNGIKNTIEQADEIFERDGKVLCRVGLIIVRTTSVANLDSKLMVMTSDLAKVKARNMKLGDAAFNVDEFVTKLVSYMGGRHHNDTQRERDDSMDWAGLGRMALGICRRPPTIGFMLGPLSVEKKERKAVRRQAERREDTAIVRPQEVCSLICASY
jgi:non-structural maintenance of chromosomes element 4